MNSRTALVLGSTGLIGGALLRRLLSTDQYDSLGVLVRREIPVAHEKLIQHIVDFDRLEDHRGLFAADDVYCCLGTTMAKAKSKEAFRRVDYDYPVMAARLAREMGARQYLIVSAMGADPESLFFYNRVKGEVERDISAAGFQAVHIFRPSLLLGDRNEKRPGEDMAQRFAPLLSLVMVGPMKKYLPIQAKAVAGAMALMASRNNTGIFIHESDEMQRIS